MKIDKRELSVLVTLMILVVSVLTAGCAEEQDTEEQTVVISMSSDPDNFDPVEYNTVYTHYIFAQTHDRLVRNNPDGMANTGGTTVAESFSISDDGLTYTFEIEEGIMFHHGEELTAEDVAFSIDIARGATEHEVQEGQTDDLKNIENVEVIDDYTVKMELSQIDPELLIKEGFEMLNMLPKDYIEENGYEEYLEHMYGTGPYQFVEYQGGTHILLEKSDVFDRGEVSIPNVKFEIYDDDAAATVALGEGDVHYMERIEADLYYELKDDENIVTRKQPTNNYFSVVFNHNTEPWGDVRVRKAFAYAVDTKEIITEVRGEELAITSKSPLPPVHPAGPDYDEINMYDQDYDKAKQLLEDAGYPDGFSTKMMVYGPPQEMEATIMQEQVAEVGIEMEVERVTWPRQLEMMEAGEAPLAYGGMATGASAYGALHYYLPYSSINYFGGFVNDTEYTEKIEEALRTADPEERNQKFKEAQIILNEKMHVHVMYGRHQPFAHHHSLKLPMEYNTPWDRGSATLGRIDLWEIEE